MLQAPSMGAPVFLSESIVVDRPYIDRAMHPALLLRELHVCSPPEYAMSDSVAEPNFGLAFNSLQGKVKCWLLAVQRLDPGAACPLYVLSWKK